jgi:membrane fusion protein (multidrug efflux system)
MIKRFLIAIVLLVLVGGGLIGFNMFRDKAIQDFFANMKPPAATVSTVVVKPTSWTPGIEAIGTVSAVRGVELAVETAGIVKDILFDANHKVEAGQVLVQLDDAVQRADLEAQKAQAAFDQTALNRARELQRKGVGSEANLDTAQAAASASAAQVSKLQAVVDQRRLNAPFAGTVGIPRIDPGQYLAPGTSVATLQDLETMRVDFTVPEQQLPLLKIGQAVRLGVGGDDMPFAGSIRGIDPRIDPASRLVSVRAEVANTEDRLSPGQFVQVRVELPEEDGILALPQTALTSSLYGDYVFVVRPAAPDAAKPADTPATTEPAPPATGAAEPEKPALVLSQVFVRPGRRNGGLVEILQGVKAGDEIVTAGQNRLFNGMSVAVDNTVDPSKPGTPQEAAAR